MSVYVFCVDSSVATSNDVTRERLNTRRAGKRKSTGGGRLGRRRKKGVEFLDDCEQGDAQVWNWIAKVYFSSDKLRLFLF